VSNVYYSIPFFFFLAGSYLLLYCTVVSELSCHPQTNHSIVLSCVFCFLIHSSLTRWISFRFPQIRVFEVSIIVSRSGSGSGSVCTIPITTAVAVADVIVVGGERGIVVCFFLGLLGLLVLAFATTTTPETGSCSVRFESSVHKTKPTI